MSQKRHPDEGKSRSEGNSSSPDEKRRRFDFGSVVEEVIKIQSVQHLLEPVLEPLIRRVVKEEIEVALKKHLTNVKRTSAKEIGLSKSRSLKLQLISNLSLPVFTGARIDVEDSPAVKVVLVDVLSGKIVDSGPESSAKVELVVLEGDFDGDEGDSWTFEEFKSNIVREREGKRPLLTGDVVFNLKEGIGMVGEISFTDNSSWTRSRKFRLGARVLDNFDGIRIQEAKTESFVVRDHRGELYKKHYPPVLSDEVWRLEKIGKDGAFHKRLSHEDVNTVQDFLMLLFLDPTRLRKILGTGMSAKMWEVTIEHARTCVLDNRVHLYYPSASERKTGVVFNNVGQIMGLLTECQYVTTDKLSESQKADAQSWAVSAFQHWNEVVSFDDESVLLDSSSQLSNVLYPSGLSRTDHPDPSKLLASHNTCSPDTFSSIYNLDEFDLHSIENVGLRYNQTSSFPGQASSNPLICGADSLTRAFPKEDHLQFFNTELQSRSLHLEAEADLQTAVDSFLLTRSAAVVASSTAVAIDKAQRRWTKISSVLKWFSIRKIVASRRTCVREAPRY